MAIKKNLFDSLIKSSLEQGFQTLSCTYSRINNQSVSCVSGRVDDTSVDIDTTYVFEGVINNKYSLYKTETYIPERDNQTIIDTLKELAEFSKDYSPDYVTEGPQHYKKVNQNNSEVKNVELPQMKELAKEISDKLKSKGGQIVSTTQIALSCGISETLCVNSKDLVYANTSTSSEIYIGATFTENDIIKEESEYFTTNDTFNEINIDEMIRKVLRKGKDALKAEKIKSGKYTVVLSYQPLAVLLDALLSHLSGRKFYEKNSILLNDLNVEGALSKKLTIRSDSQTKSPITTVVDSDLRPVKNKEYVIKSGQIMQVLYNNEYANKSNTQSSCLSGATFRVKEGKESLEEAIANIKKGVYVTHITSLHSSLDPTSLRFSAPIKGYYVENGKITHSIDLAMMASDCKEIAKNISKLTNTINDQHGMFVPEAVIKNINIVSIK